jgi:hypothetical protein
MKILIIPDIHNKIFKSNLIIKKENPDQIVYLGDWFDSFDDDLTLTEATTRYLKDILYDEDKIFIYGNHDLHYRFNYDNIIGTGYTKEKYNLINSILTYDDWNQFRSYYKVDNWYLSHAGICKSLVMHPITGFSQKHLDELIKSQFLNLQYNDDRSPLYEIGHNRGGKNKIGGLTWCDIGEFEPIENINQIFGHTYQNHPMFITNKQKNTKNWCIDSYLDFYGMIIDGKFDIYKFDKGEIDE